MTPGLGSGLQLQLLRAYAERCAIRKQVARGRGAKLRVVAAT
jgi:hypothetical protein